MHIVEVISNDPYKNVCFSGTGEKKHQSKKEKMKERRERWLNSEYLLTFSSSLSRKEKLLYHQLSREQSWNAHVRLFLSPWAVLWFYHGPTGNSEMDMAGSLMPHPDFDACNLSGRSMRRVTQAPSKVIIIRIKWGSWLQLKPKPQSCHVALSGN